MWIIFLAPTKRIPILPFTPPFSLSVSFASLHLVLDCCATVSRGGRRRFGNMAGVFLVMASAARALDRWDSELEFLRKIAKIATGEIVSSKHWKILIKGGDRGVMDDFLFDFEIWMKNAGLK